MQLLTSGVYSLFQPIGHAIKGGAGAGLVLVPAGRAADPKRANRLLTDLDDNRTLQ